LSLVVTAGVPVPKTCPARVTGQEFIQKTPLQLDPMLGFCCYCEFYRFWYSFASIGIIQIH
jgi:hypothetical protein